MDNRDLPVKVSPHSTTWGFYRIKWAVAMIFIVLRENFWHTGRSVYQQKQDKFENVFRCSLPAAQEL